MKKKPRISVVLFVLLFLIGLGVMLYPAASDYYVRWQLSKKIEQYNHVTEAKKADYTKLWEAAEDYNRYLAEKESQFMLSDEEKELIPTLLNPLGYGMMGYISIPEIHVEVPVYQGTDEKQLQSGAGWWPGSSLPTGGEGTHCVITAHTGLAKAKLFTDIDQLVEGDTFTLTILDRTMTYQVDQVIVTEPEDISELYIQDGMDYVTLYTCTPYGVNTHRLLVRGVRVMEDDTFESGQNTIPIGIVPLLIFILSGLLLLILWLKRKRGDKGAFYEHQRRR